MVKKFLCLGIETSCDETAASVVQTLHQSKHGAGQAEQTILSNVVRSQENLHKLYGGIVPELASRAHIESLLPVLERSLKKAGKKLTDLDAIAVSHTPGLIGALLIGVSAAKALSLALKIPLIGVNHIQAHLYAWNLQPKTKCKIRNAKYETQNNRKNFAICNSRFALPSYPAIGLVASGGHTSIYLVKSPIIYVRIAQTADDAAGEAFDKVAHILGLGYPGGPAIEKIARRGDPQAVRFPPPEFSRHSLDFSFSGIKTAVLYYAKGQNASRRSPLKKNINIPDVAAGFQAAVIKTLVDKVVRAAHQYRVNSIILGGGVIRNKTIRNKFLDSAKENKFNIAIPAPGLCTDNAAMIAGIGYHLARAKKFSNLYLDAVPT